MDFLTTIDRNEATGTAIKGLFKEFAVIHVTGEPFESQEPYWLSQASQIGSLVIMDEDKTTGNKTGNFWIDIRYDPEYPNLFVHANTRQPLHTDGSYESQAPNISFFYCIEAADLGGATTFVPIATVQKALAAEYPELLARLESEPVLFSKGNDSKCVPIFCEGRCNWNYFRTDKSELPQRFHNYLEDRIINMGVVYPVSLRPGEAVFFRDELVLHGRNAFLGNRWLRKGGIQWTTP